MGDERWVKNQSGVVSRQSAVGEERFVGVMGFVEFVGKAQSAISIQRLTIDVVCEVFWVRGVCWVC